MENKLLLKHLLETLRIEHNIELQTRDNDMSLYCVSDSQELELYFNRQVVDWVASGNCELVILIGETE